jgi:hypothetical protein
MNIITNEALIKRNSRIAQISMIAGLMVLAGGMVISFTSAYQKYFYLSLISLLLGFILSQIGIHYTNLYGRRPRPDELLNQGLKGLDGKYTIYHYMTPVPHLLVGPSGVWILMPRSQKGRITFSKGRWKQSGGNWYLKMFAQDGLGRPDIDIATEQEKLNRVFTSGLAEGAVPQIQVALVFTAPGVQIEIPEDAEPIAQTIGVEKLKETVRKAAKTKPLPPPAIEQITALFPDESK